MNLTLFLRGGRGLKKCWNGEWHNDIKSLYLMYKYCDWSGVFDYEQFNIWRVTLTNKVRWKSEMF